MRESLKSLIAEGKTDQAFHLLNSRLCNSAERQQVIALMNQWNRLQDAIRLDNISPADAHPQGNRITYALLETIEKLSDKDFCFWRLTASTITGGIGLVTFALLILSAFYWFSEPFSISVSVVGVDGQSVKDLNGEAQIRIRHSTEFPAMIGKDGIAHFENIPARFRRDSVRIWLVRSGGISYDGDSTYRLGFSQSVILRVHPYKWDVLEGNIKDCETQLPIANVRIVYRDTAVMTNQDGYFKMKIPTQKQHETIEISVLKDGYTPKYGKATPQTEAIFDPCLEKIKKR